MEALKPTLWCGFVICCVACAAPVERDVAIISPAASELEVITELPSRGPFPHRMMYLLLQR